MNNEMRLLGRMPQADFQHAVRFGHSAAPQFADARAAAVQHRRERLSQHMSEARRINCVPLKLRAIDMTRLLLFT